MRKFKTLNKTLLLKFGQSALPGKLHGPVQNRECLFVTGKPLLPANICHLFHVLHYATKRIFFLIPSPYLSRQIQYNYTAQFIYKWNDKCYDLLCVLKTIGFAIFCNSAIGAPGVHELQKTCGSQKHPVCMNIQRTAVERGKYFKSSLPNHQPRRRAIRHLVARSGVLIRYCSRI